ncbi:MAG: isopentenyl phosphate kinase family protein [Anaerolineae bacterium]|nr:isopentenyl phosphate kinase family protein [Anaerolineae bacterium]
MNDNLVFVKLGGSLITDKRTRATPHKSVISRMANEIRSAQAKDKSLRIVMGHGSGSFGHWEANRYDTRHGVRTPEQWQGMAKVAAAAARLNRIVVDAFLKAGVSVLSLQPSAFVQADKGQIAGFPEDTLRRALAAGLIPLIYGDVAFDRSWGATILSTEDLFFHLTEQMPPSRILLLGNAPGVMNSGDHTLIPVITPDTYPEVEKHLRGPQYPDVTGGMADKVKQMVNLVKRIAGLQVWILTGNEPGNLEQALLHPENTPGTRITESN